MGRYIAAIIDTINKGDSLHAIIKPADRIKQTIEYYKKE
jgi:ribose-phosphate pyrophosphokinase